MKISREDVLHVAELAHLELSAAEVETFQKQLDSILTYIGKLNELDTSAVEPMAQVLSGVSAAPAAAGETSALRDDLPAACGVTEEVLAGAPDPSPPYFRVPKVIER
jgi:aspartyl-tRNA(Asn)/glutamyl-tRNA(Gln) amidotransferase subunit C